MKKPKQLKSSTSIVTSGGNLPADFDMSQVAGAGAEDISTEDLPRPSLKLLQPLSPHVTLGKNEYIEGAKPGMFVSEMTRTLYSGKVDQIDDVLPLVFVPVKYTRREVEFQRNRGGFVAEHMPGSKITEGVRVIIGENEKQHRITENDTELVDTSIFYGLILDPSESREPTQGIISLSVTGKRFAKNWNAYMNGLRDKSTHGSYQPPLFSRVYNLYSSLISDNPKGAYYVWEFQLNTVLDATNNGHRSIIAAAMEYLQLIQEDKIVVQHSDA